ncbi:hypothetical protein LGKMAHEF_00688 [Aeromonas salmonicida]|nr:GntR family transcriptional regulator [Aeromonas salmonicida]SUU69994.1 GntR family transcriptional regulator [Aeromonas salmonicida]
MTIWTPDLTPFDGPLYLKLVKAIEQAIHDGTLPPRTRLPTHRALADRLGVTVGTITRAYGEAERPACWRPRWDTAPGSKGQVRIRPMSG